MGGTLQGTTEHIRPSWASSGSWSFYIVWDVQSQNEANLTSSVRARMYIAGATDGWTFDTVASRDHTLRVSSTDSWSARINLSSASYPELLRTYTQTISHNSSTGAGSVIIGGTADLTASGSGSIWGPGNCSVSNTTVTLPTIELPTKTRVKVGGTWRESTDLYVKVGGTCRKAKELHVKVGGTWRKAT